MATTMMDRFVRWNLDFDGDLYGRDERERLRWYEAMTTAAQVQAIAVPWAAAALVWTVGEPVAIPLIVVLAAMLIPLAFTAIYVQSRRVDTTPRVWTAKRVLVSTLMGMPYTVFGIGALYHLDGSGSTVWRSATIGALIGLVAGAAGQIVQMRRRRRLDAAIVPDED